MPDVLMQEVFQGAVDRALRDVMPRVAGIALLQGGPPPAGKVYTVHTVFEGDTNADLSMCADAAVFTRLTQRITQQEQIAQEDLADAAKELFNVFCGHIAVDLFRTAKLTLRFQIPQFSKGWQIPSGHIWLFTLNYRGDRNESIQVIHHARADLEPLDRVRPSA